MNANEVIANLASKKSKLKINANDDVNMSQSSNDVIPTAICVSALIDMNRLLLPNLDKLIKVIFTCLRPLRRFGLRPEPIAFAIGLFIRFTPVLIEKSAILAQAYRARTSKYGNWRIVLPLALIAVDDADHIAEAMRARGGLEQL